ncbi:hypothetical protein C8R43DRAFT_1129581 [Mycena crocata]|nr:hypothetical protein C8R43DRAFT_1129581 [Mycena crocata]
MAALEPQYAVAFPTTDKNFQPAPRPRPPHLPFRRISLPSNTRRESVVSVASFDSLPEEGESSPGSPAIPVVMRNVNPARRPKVRPVSSNRKLVRPLDDAKEAKRRNVIQEFYETERAYVDGLEMIYSSSQLQSSQLRLWWTRVTPGEAALESAGQGKKYQRLRQRRLAVQDGSHAPVHDEEEDADAPIIASLETSQPLLQRSDLASVFSNFVDIWNLHRAFFASLSDFLSIDASSSTLLVDPPPLSPVLLSHFPYLSLYNPFVTAFPSTISAMSNLATPPTAAHSNPHYSPAFSAYLLAQEADPRCGKLKLRDWLLTIVQRCPRYLLLLKDLIGCTDPDDPEHAQLTAVHALVAKITLTLNTSIHTHAQTLSLLALQRATPSLPFQLIVPGRALIRRGPLAHVERSEPSRDREFLLFSDCIVWLEAAEDGWSGSGNNSNTNSPSGNGSNPNNLSPVRPAMMRTRSKSEAELPVRSEIDEVVGGTRSALPPMPLPLPPMPMPMQRKSAYHHPVSRMKRRRHASSGTGDEGRWVYKGRVELVDLEVVVITPPREVGEERRFEVLSPGGSFVLYADSETERDAWTEAIRQTKSALFVSLNATHPDSTLTSSSSTSHLRRSLQALPFPPSDERLATLNEGPGKSGKRHKRKGSKKVERRGRVEHWVPAIWIPDEKTEGCMRCGRPFGWRRRRHHCRLCGRCVCASCSERTFFISDPNAPRDDNASASKPARACNACYETVFPLLDDPEDEEDADAAAGSTRDPNSNTMSDAHSNTMNSLSNFPSWLSMPSLPLAATPTTDPAALMAIDRDRGGQHLKLQSQKYERLRRGAANDFRANVSEDFLRLGLHAVDGNGSHVEMAGDRVRVKSPPPRPRSYHQILGDFEEEEAKYPRDARGGGRRGGGRGRGWDGIGGGTVVVDLSEPRKEDTARRNKRFSLPAVALQTTSVTARTQTQVVLEGRSGTRGGGGAGGGDGRVPARAKRFSLVLGTRTHVHKPQHSEAGGAQGGRIEEDQAGELGKGLAAGKLSELLSRQRGHRIA